MPEKNKKIPKIRFKEFEWEWEEFELWEIVKFSKWKWLSKDDILDNWKYKCIHYWELFTKYWAVIKDIKSFTNLEGNYIYSEENEILMPTSDVTPNWLATWSALFEKWVLLWWDILIIKWKKLKNDFFTQSIPFYRKWIMRLVSWSTVYHLYWNDLKKLKISLPSLEEQEKIANFLNAIDESIELKEIELKKLKEYKKWIMQQIFTKSNPAGGGGDN